MDYLYKTPRLIGQVLFVVFLLVVLGAQVVSAQTALPPCTESLALELTDSDGVPQAVDVDKNDNGLIEICDLEGLYEMRYVPDGSGYRPSATADINRIGCPSTCTGFELTRNLSFNSNDSYRTTANRVTYTAGSGWQPIGTSSNRFNTEFEGNGHTISHLRINRINMNFIGLFSFTGLEANIANIGLSNVRIIGTNLLGGLVGWNNGSITNSYATGSFAGTNDVSGLVGRQVGGLVGRSEGFIMNSYATGIVEGDTDVGGLTGFNNGSITNSYATGTVSGNRDVGGLVGSNSEGSITNSYATGSVSGNFNVGGLVGFNFFGSITNSYATGSVSGNFNVGGLVGLNSRGTVRNSYATSTVSGNDDVGGLIGNNTGTIRNSYATGLDTLFGVFSFTHDSTNSSTKTVVELQTPTSATGIYENWDPEVWDFGTKNDFPRLRNVPELIRIRTRVFLEGPLQ